MRRWAALVASLSMVSTAVACSGDEGGSSSGFCDDSMQEIVELWLGSPVTLTANGDDRCEIGNVTGRPTLVLTAEPRAIVIEEDEDDSEIAPPGLDLLAVYLTERLDPGSATTERLALLETFDPQASIVADCGFQLTAGEGAVSVRGRPSQLDVAPIERGTFNAGESQRVVLRVQFGSDLPGQGCSDLADENIEPVIDAVWPATAQETRFVPPPEGQGCSGSASMAVTALTAIAPNGARVALGDVVLRNTGYGWVSLIPGFACGDGALEFGFYPGGCAPTFEGIAGSSASRKGAECFADAVSAGTPVTWDLVETTEEGAPIATRYAYDGSVIVVTRDATADVFGTPVVTVDRCGLVELDGDRLEPRACEPSEGPGFRNASLVPGDGAIVRPDLYGTATVEPNVVATGAAIQITPDGVVDRVCGRFARVYSPVSFRAKGQITEDGSFVEQSFSTEPPCDPPPSDEPLEFRIPDTIPAGQWIVCVGGLVEEGCATVLVR